MLTDELVDECERLAIKVRRKVGLWAYEPLPARILAEQLRIRLLTPSDLGMAIEDVQQAECSIGWSAITVLTDPQIVIYHPHVNIIQFESNIMHELAHILRGHQPEQLGLISDFRVARKYSKLQEFEADMLGLYLQLPNVAIQYAKQKMLTISEVSKRFFMHTEVVECRYRS